MPDNQTTHEPDGTPPVATTPDPATGEPTVPQQDTDTQQAEQSKTFDAKYVEKLRGEAAQYRTQLQEAEQRQQSQLDAIAQALGLKTEEGEAPDVEKVTEQLTAAQAEARQHALDLAVYRAAGRHGADPDALLDSREFARQVADLDPADGGFADALAAAITGAVEANSKLVASAPAAPRSGGQIAGGTVAQPRPQSLTDAVAAHYARG
ncbi:hypothetical protein AB0L13_11375 [Saccharopolyspora shandongensis]|uniref:hypothetical protein n=1 Tax=Saccharopolyspora shandongensis TaxID=418495 RepID=UPI00342944B1